MAVERDNFVQTYRSQVALFTVYTQNIYIYFVFYLYLLYMFYINLIHFIIIYLYYIYIFVMFFYCAQTLQAGGGLIYAVIH